MKKKYPTRTRFFVADDIRQETPKPMLIGLFPDDVVGIKSKDGAPTKEKPYGLESLALMFSLIECGGAFDATFSLQDPNGNPLADAKIEGGLDATRQKNIHFIAKFVPFNVTAYGMYKATLTLDKKKYPFEFEIKEHTDSSEANRG